MPLSLKRTFRIIPVETVWVREIVNSFTITTTMTKSDLTKQDLIGLREKLLERINKQHEPTPKERYDQAIYNRTMNPETMPAERLREFQSHGWFLGYEPRELTPEQAAIEEEEFQSIVNEAFTSD